MANSSAQTVTEYLKEIPEKRRVEIEKVRSIIRKNLCKGFKETMNWGMICCEVPLTTYPDTYNHRPLMLAALASQKNYYVAIHDVLLPESGDGQTASEGL